MSFEDYAGAARDLEASIRAAVTDADKGLGDADIQELFFVGFAVAGVSEDGDTNYSVAPISSRPGANEENIIGLLATLVNSYGYKVVEDK